MKTTNLKSKIMAGVLCATLVGGVGTAFAATDAGTNLETWYNNQFKASTKALWDTVYKEGVQKAIAQMGWFNTTKNTAVNNVKAAGETEVTTSNETINGMLKEHTDAITAQQGTITTDMPGEYDGFVNEKNNWVDGEATKYTALANGDIKNNLDKQGTASFNKVTNEVGATKSAAIKSLEDAIAKAKGELNVLIASEQTAATAEIRTHIQGQIDAKKIEIEKATKDLEQAKKDAIEAEGLRIENAAKSELDGLVNGIVNP